MSFSCLSIFELRRKYNLCITVLHLSQESAAEEIIFHARCDFGETKVWVGKGNRWCMPCRPGVPVHCHVQTLLIPS